MSNNDIVINNLPNVARIWPELIVKVEWLGSVQYLKVLLRENYNLTVAFLRYVDPSIHQEAVRRLNGATLRGRRLVFFVNHLPPPWRAQQEFIQAEPNCNLNELLMGALRQEGDADEDEGAALEKRAEVA